MSRIRWNCPRQQKGLLIVMLVVGLVCGLVAQGYRPGQTFSSGQQPAQTPAPQRPVYQQPVYRQPAQRQATPPQAQRQQTATPASRSSMYNMQSGSSEKERNARSDNNDNATKTRKRSTKSEESSVESKSEKKSESSPAKESAKAEKSQDSDEKSTKETKADDKPSAPDSTDKLVFFSRKTGKKQIALTYDDGPNPTLTPELIDWLKANNVPATFFMEGDMVKAHKDLAKKVADYGFELANHSYNHPNLRNLSEEKIVDQLQDTHDLIKEATGIDVKMMRPPYGAHNSKVDGVCKRLGYKIINWNIDTEDWRGRSADQIVETIMSKASDGAIILMHDRKHKGRKSSLEATQRVVPALRAKGYTFVTVGELIGLDHPATEAAQQPAIPPPATTPAATPTTPDSDTSGLVPIRTLPAPLPDSTILPVPTTATPAPTLAPQ